MASNHQDAYDSIEEIQKKEIPKLLIKDEILKKREEEIHKKEVIINRPIPGFFKVAARALIFNLIIVIASHFVNFETIKNFFLKDNGASVSFIELADNKIQIPPRLNKVIKLEKDNGDSKISLSRPLSLTERDDFIQINTRNNVKHYEAVIKNLYVRSHPFGDIKIEPIKYFDYLMIVVFLLFTALAFRCYWIMKTNWRKNLPDAAALEEIESSYNNLIDIIGFSTPLFGAAILLISVLVGTSLFVNFSVPFEIKAIMVLVLSKAFTHVIDKVTDEFRKRIYAKTQFDELQDKMQEEERHKNEANQFQILQYAFLSNINHEAFIKNIDIAMKNNLTYSQQIKENLENIKALSAELEKTGSVVGGFQQLTQCFCKENKDFLEALKDPIIKKNLELLRETKQNVYSFSKINSVL